MRNHGQGRCGFTPQGSAAGAVPGRAPAKTRTHPRHPARPGPTAQRADHPATRSVDGLATSPAQWRVTLFAWLRRAPSAAADYPAPCPAPAGSPSTAPPPAARRPTAPAAAKPPAPPEPNDTTRPARHPPRTRTHRPADPTAEAPSPAPAQPDKVARSGVVPDLPPGPANPTSTSATTHRVVVPTPSVAKLRHQVSVLGLSRGAGNGNI